MNKDHRFPDNRYYTNRDNFDTYSRRLFLERFYFNDNFYDGKWRRQRIHLGQPAYRRERRVHPAYYFSASRCDYNKGLKWWRDRKYDGSVPTAAPNYSDPTLRSSLRYNDHGIKAGIVIGWPDEVELLAVIIEQIEGMRERMESLRQQMSDVEWQMTEQDHTRNLEQKRPAG